jgi:hypothetical protein
MRLILAERKADYFSREIWTEVIELKTRVKFFFWRKSFCGRKCLRTRRKGRRSNAFAPDGQITVHRRAGS